MLLHIWVFHSFYGWIIFHCMICYISHPFITWWTLRLFLLWGCCEYCCCELWCTGFCVDVCLPFSWIYNAEWIGHIIWWHDVSLFWGAPRLFPTAAAPFGSMGAPCHGSTWALSWPLHFVLLITPLDLQISLATHFQVLCSCFLLLVSR